MHIQGCNFNFTKNETPAMISSKEFPKILRLAILQNMFKRVFSRSESSQMKPNYTYSYKHLFLLPHFVKITILESV